MDKQKIINKLIEYYGNGKAAVFAENLGIAPNTLSSWKARGNIDYDLVFAKCEGINANWLLSGKGDMLLTKIPPPLQKDEGINLASNLDDVISLLKEIDSEQKRLNANYERVLECSPLISQLLQDKEKPSARVKNIEGKLDDLKQELEGKKKKT